MLQQGWSLGIIINSKLPRRLVQYNYVQLVLDYCLSVGKGNFHGDFSINFVFAIELKLGTVQTSLGSDVIGMHLNKAYATVVQFITYCVSQLPFSRICKLIGCSRTQLNSWGMLFWYRNILWSRSQQFGYESVALNTCTATEVY